MLDVFGDLPPEWESKWKKMRSDAAAGDYKPSADSRLETQFDKYVHEPELKAFLPVIQGLTKFLPLDRISASQTLEVVRNIEYNEDSTDSE